MIKLKQVICGIKGMNGRISFNVNESSDITYWNWPYCDDSIQLKYLPMLEEELKNFLFLQMNLPNYIREFTIDGRSYEIEKETLDVNGRPIGTYYNFLNMPVGDNVEALSAVLNCMKKLPELVKKRGIDIEYWNWFGTDRMSKETKKQCFYSYRPKIDSGILSARGRLSCIDKQCVSNLVEAIEKFIVKNDRYEILTKGRCKYILTRSYCDVDRPLDSTASLAIKGDARRNFYNGVELKELLEQLKIIAKEI